MPRKGLYHEWIEGKGVENVCMWAKLGLMDKQIAGNMGISLTTFYDWQKKFPKFADAIKNAKAIPNLELENAMFDLALGRTYVEEVKSILDPKTGTVVRIEKTKKQIQPNPTMQIFLAKNRMPDKYKDRVPVAERMDEEEQKVEIYIPDNGRDETK
jgi:phage terminase, small subunit|nr:MAG TPA: terminase small subunit [Caudoviricetes sp.]